MHHEHVEPNIDRENQTSEQSFAMHQQEKNVQYVFNLRMLRYMYLRHVRTDVFIFNIRHQYFLLDDAPAWLTNRLLSPILQVDLHVDPCWMILHAAGTLFIAKRPTTSTLATSTSRVPATNLRSSSSS
jgi:hypothetical protein